MSCEMSMSEGYSIYVSVGDSSLFWNGMEWNGRYYEYFGSIILFFVH
jgi:hypothetical protein